MDNFGPSLLFGTHNPFKGDRVHLCGIAAHDQNNVGILDIDVMIGH
jgi:hypothetical protein